MALPKPPKVFLNPGERVYYYKFSVDGRMYRKSTGLTNRAEAQDVADRLWHEKMLHRANMAVAKGHTPSGLKDWTLDYAAIQFLDFKLSKFERSEEEASRRLKVIVETIGPDTLLSEMTTSYIMENYVKPRLAYRKRDGKPLSPVTINGELAVLQWMLTYVRKRDGMSHLPLVDFDELKRQAPPKDARVLSTDEQSKLLKAAPDHLRPILELALETGFRRATLVSLRWSHIDWQREMINVHIKGQKPFSVFLTKRIRQILKGVPREPGEDHVFTFVADRSVRNPKNNQVYEAGKRYPVNYYTLRNQFDALCKSVGIVAKMHDLRRTFATELNDRTGLAETGMMMGHSDTKTTQLYVKRMTQAQRELAERVAADRQRARLRASA